MTDRTFVDTNVLVYAYDLDAGAKHEIANRVVDALWDEQAGVVSVQVLEEFYVTVTRKIRSPLSKDLARVVVSHYIKWCVGIEPAEINVAFRIEDGSLINFWDALIVSSALKSGASRILSEDFNAGQRIAGVLIENPFATIS